MRACSEKAITFPCGDARLFGILHEPRPPVDTGILILVGGPQYRVGSHRMFVGMARRLVSRGFAVLRFDCSGMGDSSGAFPGFDRLDANVAAALQQLRAHCPTLRRLVLLGLCDGATAAAYYAPHDPDVRGVVLLNPWVHTEAGEAAAYLWHYYPRRLWQRELWRALVRRRMDLARAGSDFLSTVRVLTARKPAAHSFVDRMRDALAAFDGRVLVAASQNDYTARQFLDLWARDARWRDIREAARLVRLEGADHTLSARADLDTFCDAVAGWLGRAAVEKPDSEPMRA